MSEEKKPIQGYGYGVTETTKSVDEGGFNALEPGIHDGVTFKEVKLEKLTDTSESEVLMLIFEKDGASVRDIVFAVDPQRIIDNYDKYPGKPSKVKDDSVGLAKGEIPSVEQKIGQAFGRFNTRLGAYLNAFIKDSTAALTGNFDSYEGICNAVIEKLTPFIGSTVRLKVVLNQDDYSSFPAFGSFIEFEIPQNLSKLSITRGDKMERGSSVPGSGNVASPPPGMSAPAGNTAPPPPPPPPPGGVKG